MEQRQLHDAVVVITGASSGIGRATAHRFARQGTRLVLAARREDALDDVVAECKRLGSDAISVPTDVTDAAAMTSLAFVAAETFGRIDIWVNNAGIGAIGEFTKVPLSAHEQVIKTNLLGYLYGAYAALPHFQRRRAGVLINVNSEGGWVPAPYAVAYTASKFGLRGLSESLRSELGRWPAIHVCDVFPAFIDTPGIRHAGNYTGREVRPVPPLYDPYEVADAIVSLALRPRPAVTVGRAATMARAAHFLFPQLMGRALERFARYYFARARSTPVSSGNLFHPPPDVPRVHGDWSQRAKPPQASTAGICLLAGLAVGLWFVRR